MSKSEKRRADSLFEAAIGHFRRQQAEAAGQLLEQCLALDPRHAEALHLLGVIALQRNDLATSLSLLERAVDIAPDNADYQANLAQVCVGLQRLPQALAAFERAARSDTQDPDLLLGAASCLAMLGDLRRAEAAFRQLVEKHPRYALGWLNLANVLSHQERYDEACESYVRALTLAPDSPDAHCNYGIALNKTGRHDQAEREFRACLRRVPDHDPARIGLAMTLNNLRRHAEAETICREVLTRNAARTQAWPVLGKALVGQKRWHEALQCYREHARNSPRDAEAFADLGDILMRTGNTKEAFQAFDKALTAGKPTEHVWMLRALALLSTGRIAEGAVEYTHRDQRSAFAARHPGRALATHLPPSLHGKEIALVGEQGIGDEIFFLRYVPELKGRGGSVRYYCSPKIRSILLRSPFLDRVAVNSDAAGAEGADYLVMAGDLMRLLGPVESPCDALPPGPAAEEVSAARAATGFQYYLRVYYPSLPPPFPLETNAERLATTAARLGKLGNPPFVGLSWRAGTAPADQRGHAWLLSKEIDPASLAAGLRDVPGTMIALQRFPGEGEIAALSDLLGRPVLDFSAANQDLEEMLALLAVLDGYVGVSNTNLHLRASLGKSAHVLVPWPAEWRWMTAGSVSPWFPRFRVYRQRADGDWGPACDRLRLDLAAAYGER